MIDLPYDKYCPKSIESYAQRLIGKSLRGALGNNIKQNYRGKGKFGQIVEDLYFLYKPNSDSEPDFVEAGVELKTAPIKVIRAGYVSKERLVFNTIDYNVEHLKTFRNSSFWKKNQLLLIMFYLHRYDSSEIDYIFKIIRLWQFPATDLKIIKDDWKKIVSKIKLGKAHEISEGDTLYLGACTKGANSSTLRSQPFSSEPAMQRAFSLKSKYLNFIIDKSLAGEEVIIGYDEYDRILNEDNLVNEPRAVYRRLSDAEPVIKSASDFEPGETFEDLVIRRFTPFVGKSIGEIGEELIIEETSSKQILQIIALRIMGVSKRKVEEFEKADVIMKTIKEESNGNLKESMSFAQIQFKDIIHEQWEESYWYETLTKRFFFVVFRKDKEGILRLRKVMFWTMPWNGLQKAETFWQHTKAQIEKGIFNSFYKISDNKLCHVRPKGRNSADLMETAFGTWEKKKSYWLNSSYIKGVIE